MAPAGPYFRDVLFRRRQCVFIAFDVLYLNGKDLRTLPLIGRKAMLKKLLRRKRSPNGQEFLLNAPADIPTPPINIILNWKPKS